MAVSGMVNSLCEQFLDSIPAFVIESSSSVNDLALSVRVICALRRTGYATRLSRQVAERVKQLAGERGRYSKSVNFAGVCSTEPIIREYAFVENAWHKSLSRMSGG